MEIKKKLATTTSVDADLFFNDQEETPLRTVNRIAYQKSSYADAAYLRFAEVMPLPRAVNTHSFQSACEDVYNGLCEFCILPLENTSEGQLHTFSRLIDRYGLKIAATCDITAGDGTRTTKFALLQKLLIPLDRVKFKSAPCFEFSYPMSSDPAPAALLQAAKMCGLRLLRVETRPQIEKDMPALGHYVFDTEGGDLFSYLLFLSMTAPEHEIIGVYPHL
jgi:prephenate dehydratase